MRCHPSNLVPSDASVNLGSKDLDELRFIKRGFKSWRADMAQSVLGLLALSLPVQGRRQERARDSDSKEIRLSLFGVPPMS